MQILLMTRLKALIQYKMLAKDAETKAMVGQETDVGLIDELEGIRKHKEVTLSS